MKLSPQDEEMTHFAVLLSSFRKFKVRTVYGVSTSRSQGCHLNLYKKRLSTSFSEVLLPPKYLNTEVRIKPSVINIGSQKVYSHTCEHH